VRKSMPSSAPPKMHTKVIPAISSDGISNTPSLRECPEGPYSCVPRCFVLLLVTTVARLRPSRRHQARSLVRTRRVALQAVHDTRLGCAEGDPVLRGVLKRNEERLGTPQRLLAQILPPLELELVGELADERPVIAPGAPERHVRRCGRPVPEVQDTDVLQH